MDIVLVHGAGGRPTTWSEVEPLLAAMGHRTVAVTNPLTSLDEDVAHTTTVVEEFIEGTAGPLLLVGHSYGGAVITNVGRHPAVRGLVYIAAFGPDEGETVNGIVERYEPAEISAYMRRGPNGEWKSEASEEFWAEIGPDLRPRNGPSSRPRDARRRTSSSPSRPESRPGAPCLPGIWSPTTTAPCARTRSATWPPVWGPSPSTSPAATTRRSCTRDGWPT